MTNKRDLTEFVMFGTGPLAPKPKPPINELVERLRDHRSGLAHGTCMDCYSTVMDEAADEIEKNDQLIVLNSLLRARLGEMVALMDGDIEFGKVTAGDTRKMLLKQAKELLS